MRYKEKLELPFETVYELITNEDGADFGVAVADIVKSEPHYHRITKEIYVLLRGALRITIGGRVSHVLTQAGSAVEISPGKLHWAESISPGVPARVAVISFPAWSREDHIVAS